LLCLKVALRVHRTHRHAAEIQLLQQLADAALIQMNIEFGGDAVTQVMSFAGLLPSLDGRVGKSPAKAAAGHQGPLDPVTRSRPSTPMVRPRRMIRDGRPPY